ncbi:proline-rich protein 18 [Gallus gallus]|uniref:proline-rich protein 18 n=1 Tax=Gallus gallus TaxID=9031 RepID=UPI001AE7719E|nr:proline-rich protein 18 [Gallus gallus]
MEPAVGPDGAGVPEAARDRSESADDRRGLPGSPRSRREGRAVLGAGGGRAGGGLRRAEPRPAAPAERTRAPPPARAAGGAPAMGLQPRRAAGPCPPAGRCAALPWARGEEQEGVPGRAASLPPLLPAPPAAAAAAARAQPKKPTAAAVPRKAAPRPADEKAARKARGTPAERAGPVSGSWPCTSLQRRPPAERGARPQPGAPQPRGRSGAPGAGGRSCESPGGAAGEPRFALSLPPEAVRLLQRRSTERQRAQPGSGTGTGGGTAAARRGARSGGDVRALLKVSLLNDRHRYDDEEYEEEEAAAPGAAPDEGLVRKCTEWLRGVESAAGRERGDRLGSLPHLGAR